MNGLNIYQVTTPLTHNTRDQAGLNNDSNVGGEPHTTIQVSNAQYIGAAAYSQPAHFLLSHASDGSTRELAAGEAAA